MCLKMAMGTDKISVITVCRNCVNEIEATIKSVLSQTYPNVEYLVVDGASTDGTLSVVSKYKDGIAKFISEPDKGIYNAMNKGVEMATGKWCIFMNAGDKFVSNSVLSEMFALNHPQTETKVYYGNTTFTYEDGSKRSLKAVTVFPTILRCQPFCHQSAFYNIEKKRDPFFDEEYKIVSDYNTSLWYYVKYGSNAFEHRDLLVSEFAAYGGASTTAKNRQKIELEFLSVWKHYDICRKRYIVERLKYFIMYQQPFGFFKSWLQKYSTLKIKQFNDKREII